MECEPDRQALEDCIADLEGGARGYAFAMVWRLKAPFWSYSKQGSVVADDDLYGGSYRLMENVPKTLWVASLISSISAIRQSRGCHQTQYEGAWFRPQPSVEAVRPGANG